MSKRIFTKEEIKELLKNKNISRCSERSITYRRDFKIRSVKEYNDEGLTSNEIFKKAGLDSRLIGRKNPQDCIRRWIKIDKDKGPKALGLERRGGNTRKKQEKPKDKTDKDKIKRLELEIKYLKAENHFLAKLRAKRK